MQQSARNNNTVECNVCVMTVGSQLKYETQVAARLPLGSSTVVGVILRRSLDRFLGYRRLKVTWKVGPDAVLFALSATQRPEYSL